jgi:hypothetical protein
MFNLKIMFKMEFPSVLKELRDLKPVLRIFFPKIDAVRNTDEKK